MRANSSVRSREQLRGAVEDLGALPRGQRAGAVHARSRAATARSTSARAARGHAVDLVAVEGRAHDELVAGGGAPTQSSPIGRVRMAAAFLVGAGQPIDRMGGELELAVEHLLEQRALAAGAPDLELGVVERAEAQRARATA